MAWQKGKIRNVGGTSTADRSRFVYYNIGFWPWLATLPRYFVGGLLVGVLTAVPVVVFGLSKPITSAKASAVEEQVIKDNESSHLAQARALHMNTYKGYTKKWCSPPIAGHKCGQELLTWCETHADWACPVPATGAALEAHCSSVPGDDICPHSIHR